MPYVPKQLGGLQFNDYPFWAHLYALMPSDDPLREEVGHMVEAKRDLMSIPGFEGNSDIKDVNGEMINVDNADLYDGDVDYPSMIAVDDPWLKPLLEKGVELIGKIEAKYGNSPEHELLMQETGIIKAKEQSLLNGIGYDQSPMFQFGVGENGIMKMQDVLYDLEPNEREGYFTEWKYKDPAAVEQTAKEFGVTGIQKGYKVLNEQGSEWASEWNKPDCDPAKLREIAGRSRKTIEEIGKNIEQFEKKFIEDKKLPEGERKALNITNRSDAYEKLDLISDVEAGENGERSINNHYKKRVQTYEENLERQLISADFKKLRRDHFNGSINTLKDSPLAKAVNDIIFNCDIPYINDDKGHKDFKNNIFVFSSIMMAEQMQKAKEEAMKAPESPVSKAVIKLVDDHMKEPAVLRMLTEQENKLAEQKVAKIEVGEESKALELNQKLLAGMAKTVQNSKEREDPNYIERIRKQITFTLARVIAIKTAATTVKSLQAGAEDAGQKLSKQEIKQITADLMEPGRIEATAEDIQNRDDFKHMINKATTYQSLSQLLNDAATGKGDGIMNHLAKARKEILQRDTYDNRRENKELQAKKEQMKPKGNLINM